MKKIGRNEPCPCGSGQKYKKCCLGKVDLSPVESPLKILSSEESHLGLLPSFLQGGYRYRCVFNRLYKRPATETFHEFLVNVVKWTFGEKWWKQQVGMPEGKWHVVLKWSKSLTEFQISNMSEQNKLSDGITYEGDAPGEIWALITFGYDLFCLQTKNQLPLRMINRLKSQKNFQAARYEILVAAIMLRAGYDIDFLDERGMKEKHCEFIATHKVTKLTIGIEAKSRVRSGGYDGSFEYLPGKDSRAMQGLIKKATKQSPEGIPYFIFVDINAPLTPDVPIEEKTWFHDIKRTIGGMQLPTEDNPESYTALIVTNFSFHTELKDQPASPGEYGILVPMYSLNPILGSLWIDEMMTNLGNYPSVPFEV